MTNQLCSCATSASPHRPPVTLYMHDSWSTIIIRSHPPMPLVPGDPFEYVKSFTPNRLAQTSPQTQFGEPTPLIMHTAARRHVKHLTACEGPSL
eukprot:38268-Eustigmatos_ZCMA.PRE.1